MALVAPVGNALIVLVLCSMAWGRYLSDFRNGLAELAGATAPVASYRAVRRLVRAPLAAWGGTLLDLAVLKTGRSHSVALFVDPERSVSAD